jgi:hypothetical protein
MITVVFSHRVAFRILRVRESRATATGTESCRPIRDACPLANQGQLGDDPRAASARAGERKPPAQSLDAVSEATEP